MNTRIFILSLPAKMFTEHHLPVTMEREGNESPEEAHIWSEDTHLLFYSISAVIRGTSKYLICDCP